MLSIMTLSIAALRILTHIITKNKMLSIMTFGIAGLSILTHSILTHSITIKKQDAQGIDIQLSSTRPNDS